jgi:hypothetical protein
MLGSPGSLRVLELEAVWRLRSDPSRLTSSRLSAHGVTVLQQVLTPAYLFNLTIDLDREEAHQLGDPTSYPPLADLEVHAKIKAISVPFGLVEDVEIPPIRLPVRG